MRHGSLTDVVFLARRTWNAVCSPSGLWSTGSCWTTGVPQNGDDVRIVGNYLVAFDFVDGLKLNSLYLGAGAHLRKLAGTQGVN